MRCRDADRKLSWILLTALSLCLMASAIGFGRPATDYAAVPTASGSTQVRALPVEVYPEGFRQRTLNLKAGYYSILLINRSGIRVLEFQLERMPGASIVGAPEQQVFANSNNFRTSMLSRMVNLTPGTYRLRVSDRSSWVCTIVVK
jgi:hypothetical protein